MQDAEIGPHCPSTEQRSELCYGRGLRSAWRLDPEVTFLNHGAYGATHVAVLEEQQYWQDLMESHPTRFFKQQLPEAIRSAAQSLGRYVGADGNDLAFVRNATSGVNAVLRSIDLGPGDRVIQTSQRYDSVGAAASFVAEATGAELVTVDFRLPVTSTDHVLDSIEAAVRSDATLVIVDHVTSSSAIKMPLEDIVEICRRKGAKTLVDGAHAPGQIDLDVSSIDADWYIGNCHKWLGAPRGAAFVYASQNAREDLHPTVTSKLVGQGFPDEFDLVGTDDYTPWLCVPKSIEVHDALGGASLRRRNRELASQVADNLAREFGTETVTGPAMRTAMVAVRLPLCCHASRNEAVLLANAIRQEEKIDLGISAYNDDLWLRLSAYAYNEKADYEGLGEVLKKWLTKLGLAS